MAVEFMEILKVGGPVTAVSVVFLYYMDKQSRRDGESLNGHLKRQEKVMDNNTKGWNKNTKALTELITLVKKLNGRR